MRFGGRVSAHPVPTVRPSQLDTPTQSGRAVGERAKTTATIVASSIPGM